MTRRFLLTISMGLLSSMLLIAGSPIYAQKQKTKVDQIIPKSPAIWHDPGRVEALDFKYGPGGKENEPNGTFTFTEEDTGGTNPKIKVKDAAGRSWGVKWGSEVHSEVFASRLAWAAGYYVEPSYFVPSGKVSGVTDLHRAKKYVSSDGSFTNARFELKEKGIDKKTGEEGWRWDNNPFVGTKELNGLKIIMMLTSNWDSKDQRDVSRGSNTAIYEKKKTGEVMYVFSDWGGSMGKWGGVLKREKWDCHGYAEQNKKFVTGVKGGTVEFGYSGQRTEDVREGIRVSDVAWLVGYIGRISDTQIRDGLVASGATNEEVGCFTAAIRERINQLKDAARK